MILPYEYLTLPLDNDATSHQVGAAWPTIKEEIYNILERYHSTTGHMTAIALFKLGFDEWYNNPKMVYLSVDYDSSEAGWSPVLDEMQKYLDGLGLDLHAYLEHNLAGAPWLSTCPLKLSDAEIHDEEKDYARTRQLGPSASQSTYCMEGTDKASWYQ
ncbi:hypothetical protein B0T25DRAFT_633097 [Lasiosphaeria hispida]|uniref:Uncharacterized protein n=1 Tax=Lasiosphaeria hispida TaxID=260671 RepID=A0AAJ0HFC4_9PEZI|nr:hypothetical protein B0T25DRAFT_633097 [Lasiosphaeria hispida]